MYEIAVIIVCLMVSPIPQCMKVAPRAEAELRTFPVVEECHEFGNELGRLLAHTSGAREGTDYEVHVACKPVGETGA